MATNMNEISIPVRLKILQDSVASFQKILDNLQPNTKNWHDLNKLINSMSAEAQKLQAQLSKPFSSQQQFNSTEKTIDKLEEAAARVSIVMQGLKFSDIKLTPAQTQELQKFEDEINKIRESYQRLQESTKAKLLSNTNTATLIGGLKGNVLEKSFSEIESAVDQHINNLKIKVEEKNKSYNELLSAQSMGKSATKLVTEGLNEGSIGSEIFNKFLRQTDKGLQVKSWQNGVTKQALLDAISDMYHIEPGELQKKIEESLGKSLSKININEISQTLATFGTKNNLFSGIIRKGGNATSNLPIASSELDTLRKQLDEYKTVINEINHLKANDLTPVNTENTARITELTNKMHELENSIFSSNAAMSSYKTGAAQLQQANVQMRTVLQETNAQFLRQQAVLNSFNSMKMMIANFMGFYQVLNLTKRAIKEAATHIKELDSVMNKISIVTDMDTSDLWGQIDQYSKMAQTYGTTIKGAYEVSQIYYQQGLDTADVLTLTNETLKLAKVSGLDYAATTDYMTTALRGFKMEMSEAATVVDVYSNLAANTAVSQEELAVAMSKTASSMESVGSSFQETSAMIATMVAVTRESATNIGSALKSIAARYGEMKSDPLAMTDSEGEELVYNKVDAALQSVGITLKDTEGQFRNFTDVITELAEKWNQLESTQQRYIATQFAGNRQQSRFLALVSNEDLLAENMSVAENSEDVGTVQALKALDSLESKIEQVRVAYQQFYTTIGIESVWKSFLDGAKSVVNTLNGMPKLFGKIPVAAINAISIVITLFKNLAFKGLAQVANQIGPILSQSVKSGAPEMQKAGETLFDRLNMAIASKLGIAKNTGAQLAQSYAQGVQSGFFNQNATISQEQYNKMLGLATNGQLGMGGSNPFGMTTDRTALLNAAISSKVFTSAGLDIIKTGTSQQVISLIQSLSGAMTQEGNAAQEATSKVMGWATAHTTASTNLLGVSQALQLVALAIPTATRQGKLFSGALQAISGAGVAVFSVLKAIGEAAKTGQMTVPWLAIASGIMAVISGAVQMLQSTSIEAQLEEVTARAEELSNKAKELQANYNTIDTSIKKLHELEQKRYDSAEAAEEYQTAVDKLAETYPELVSSYDENNKAVLNVNAIEATLAKARDESAAATLRAVEAEADAAKVKQKQHEIAMKDSNDWLSGKLGKMATLDMFSIDYEMDEQGRTVQRRSANYDRFSEYFKNPEQIYNLEDQGINAAEQFTEILTRYNNAVEDFNVDEALNALNEFEVLANQLGFELTEHTVNDMRNSEKAIADYAGDQTIIDAANRNTINAWMNKQYRGSNSISIFKDIPELFDRGVEALYTDLQSKNDFTRGAMFNSAEELFGGIDSLLMGASEARKKEIQQILASPESYSEADIKQLIPEFANSGWLLNTFSKKTSENAQILQEKIKTLQSQADKEEVGALAQEDIDKFNSLVNNNLTLNLRNLLTSGINYAQSLKKNGQNPSDFVDQFSSFFTAVEDLDAKVRNAVIEKFINNGFTKEGLEQTQAWINENVKVDDSTKMPDLSTMIESFIPNLALTIETLEGQLTENLDSIESIFVDFTNGVKSSKLMKTIAEANKLGIKISTKDFYTDGEKFFLQQDALNNAVQDIYGNYGEQLEKYTGEQSELLEAYNSIIDEESEQGFKTGADVTSQLQLILGAQYTDYFDENGNLTEEAAKNTDEVLTAINTAYESTSTNLTNYMAWLDTIKEGLIQSVRWKQGNYSGLDGKLATSVIGSDEEEINFGYAIDRIAYLAAHPESITDEELENIELIFNAVKQFQSGASKLLSDATTKGVDYIQKYSSQYEGLSSEFVDDIATRIEQGDIIGAVTELGQETGKTVSEINQSIVEAVKRQQTDLKAASAVVKKNITLGEIESYISDHGWVTGQDEEGKNVKSYSLENFIDNQGNIIQEDLAGVYQWDAESASYKATGTLEAILSAWEAAVGFTLTKNSELYQELIQGWTSDAIKDADKIDQGKQTASAISSLSSAKLGTRVDLSKSPELVEKLGNIYEVTSEAARDAMLLALDASEFDEAEARAAIISTQSAIRSKQASRTNINTLLSSNISQDTARNYVAAITDVDASLVDDKTLEGYMKNRGFVWSAIKQEFVATEETLAWYDKQIAAATGTPEEKAALREKRNQIEQELHKNQANEAILNVLSNAEDAADALTTFQAWFPDIDINDFTTLDNEGKRKVDIEKFKDVVGADYAKLFDNYISQIADEYINNAQKAGSLMTQGTTSKTEMDAFQEAYEAVMGKGSVAKFMYDTITHTMILDPTQLHSYLTKIAAKEEFGLTPEQQKDWVDSQIEALTTDNLDFSKVLDGSATQKDTDTLRRNLEQYFKLNANKLGYRPYQESIESWATGMVDKTMTDLAEGGQTAIEALKSTGKELTVEEIENAYRAQVAPLVAISEKLSELQVGSVVAKNQIDALNTAGFTVDENGVITAVGDMVAAYKSIYAQMKATGEATITELNNTYVQLLTAEDQASVDLIEALNNASGMTYEAIGQIFTRYGIELEQALLDSANAGIARIGYNKIAITNFTKFKDYIEQAIGHTIAVGTQEYLDAYSAYVDSQINMRNQRKNNLQTAFDQLKSVTEAKVGDLLNVTYLEDAFNKSTRTNRDTLVQIAEKFGASIKDGILTISEHTDVPGLLQAVAEEAGRAGLLIPEQLAELTDAIANMLSNITSLISSGVTGTLNNTDALSLQNWAEKQGLQPLEFNQTAEGLQLTADSLALVYAEMKRIDSLQAQSLLPTIIESNDRYSTLASTLQAAAEVVQRVDFVREQVAPNQRQVEAAYKNAQQLYNGTVPLDYNQRHHLLDNEGYIETHRAASASNERGITAVITPILPDGTDLGDDWARDMAEKYANGEVELETKLTGVNGEDLEYSLKDVNMGLYETAEAAEAAADAEHEYSAAASEAAAASNSLASSLDTLTAQSSLMSDIVLNKLTDPNAMNFMSDKLPDNYQVAINAWENASQAIRTLNQAQKDEFIGVEDFYNIVNTSAGMLEAAGKEFNIKGMNASQLIEAACMNLKVVDGDLKVDLSSAGLDMVSGVDDLKNNLTDGIHELADAEVAILDAEIQVLEVLAAMEAMGDMVVDVDNNGISFELNDMFKFDENGNVQDFTDDMQAFLDQMQGAIKTSDELKEAVLAIQVNGTTLYDLFYGTAKDWEKTFGSAEAASKFMQKLSNIDWGTDINTIQTQIVDAMKDLGQNLVIDVGDNGLVGITATGQLFNIDLDDKDIAAQAQKAIDAFKADHPDFFEGTNLRNNVKQLINELNNPDSNYAQVDLQYTLKVITGEIKIEEEKDSKGKKTGRYVGEYGGAKFTADNPSAVEGYIKQAIELENEGLSHIQFNAETGEVSGTLNVGAARIKVTKNGDKTTIETDEINGKRYDGDSVEGAIKWLAQQGYADNGLAGNTWSIDGTFYEVIQDNELGITYTFTRGSDKNSWLYNGMTFSSYDAMAQYIRDIVPLEQGLSDDWHAAPQNSDEGVKTKIWTNGTATIEYNVETGEIIITADGITFKSRAEADEYLAQKAMAKQQEGSGGEITDNANGGQTIKYTSSGNDYEVEYNSTGKVQTKVTMADTGYTFIATSDTELAMGLAAAAAIAKQEAGELPELDGNQGTVTIDAKGVNYEVTLDDTGTVTVKDPSGKALEAVSEEVTKKLNQSTIDVNLKNTISTAITEALSSLPETLSSLNESAPTAAADALSNLASAATTLAGIPWGTIAEGMANLKVPEGGRKLPTGNSQTDGESIKTNVKNSIAHAKAALGNNNLQLSSSDLGAQVPAGVTKGVKSGEGEATTAAGELGTSVIQALSGAITTAMGNLTTVLENIQTTIKTRVTDTGTGLKEIETEFDTRLQSLEGSVRSHFNEMSKNATTAVNDILAAVQQLQNKISITWEINVKSGIAGLNGDWAVEFLSGFSHGEVPDALHGIGDGDGITIPITIDIEEANSKIAELVEEIKKLHQDEGKIPKVDVNNKDGIEHTTAIQDKIDQLAQKSLPVVDVDIEAAMEKLQSLIELLEQLSNMETNTNVNANTPGDNGNPNEGPEGETGESKQIEVQGVMTDISMPAGANKPVVPVDAEAQSVKTTETQTIHVEGELEETEYEGTGHIDWEGEPENTHFEGAGDVVWTGEPNLGPFHADGFIHWKSAGGSGKDTKSSPNEGTGAGSNDFVGATGNFGLAKAKGTLMGELGPELVVSNGRYFVAGQNGPEMVNLADDAIVFNHLQTESLLKKGMSNERGRAVTNERNAVAFATGNINGGPAMASASAALAALKQLRAMWESLKSASVSDLAGAGGGGGGGGGGGDDNAKVIDPKAWVDTVERWFNLMQEIAALERQITHEETLRSKIQSEWIKDGKAYVKSQKLSLESLKAQIKAQEELNISRRDYFNKRIEALENEPLGKLYTFDAETGKMQFKDSIINGKDGVMEFLTDLVGFDNLKGANHTNKEKYEILMAAGFGDYMKFDDSGNEIKMDSDNNGETTDEEMESFYENTTKAFWSHIDEFKASTESLWESIAEGENKILELETTRNEIYQEMRDNQMELEDAVLAAIEDMKQREIDALTDEREALEASTQEYIQGLSDALNKEREMYETQDQEDELNRKRRRLGILERSGASAADITSLQQEIDDQERDLYFDIQQQQIDAIQEASDKEIERLDNQIDIMTQQLEFQKEYGLLWSDVYQVMNSSAQQIASFIMNGNSEFWASSPLNTSDGFNKIFFQADQWKAYQEQVGSITDWAKFEMQEKLAVAFNTYDTAMKSQYGESYDQGNRYMKAGGYKEIFDSVYTDTADLTKATEAARKTYAGHKQYLDREAEAIRVGRNWMKSNGDTEYQPIDDNQHWAFKYAKETINGVEAYYFQSATKENHSWSNGECSKCHHKQPAPPISVSSGFGGGGSGDSSKNIAYYERSGTKYRHVLMDGTKGPWIEEEKAGQNAINFVKNKEEKQNKQQEEQKKKNASASIISVTKSASGGYVGHGIYELGEQGTETVLTAEQTQVLRNNILSNRPNSLISLLKSYNQGYSQISKLPTGITTTEDNSTTIEKVELNMNVQKIANDYDAKRAGEQALSEMLRIAKKTSAANSVRR